VASQVAALLAKDLRVELRTGEVFMTSMLFAGVLVALFIFAGFSSRRAAAESAPGMLWISTAFLAVLVVTRTFDREREDRVVQGLLLIPGAARAMFVAKLLYNWLMLSLAQSLLVLLVGVVFAVRWSEAGWVVPAALAAGGLGLCAVGTTLSALLAAIRLREVLIPIVLFPLAVPLLVAGTQCVVAAMQGSSSAGSWLTMMVAFDAMFVMLGGWLFGHALEGGEGGGGEG
jgi:heme exporter protein CcmB